MTFFARTVRSVVVAGSVLTAGVLGGAVGLVTVSTDAAAQSASNIVVTGNRRVESETIRSYFGTRGEALTAARVDEGIKALYGTGLFSDVRVSRQGGRLVVAVSENLVLNRVVFEGNRRIKSDQLAGEVESKPRGTFSQATVQSDVQRLYDIYRRTGRYDVSISPKTIEQPNGRVDLVFEITEGRKAGIRSITFVGNRAFGTQRLKDQMSTGESGILSFLRNNDVYDPDRLNADQEALRKFYLRNGYADFRVISARADLDPATNNFAITIEVDEGDQYRFGSVEIESNIRDVDSASLRSALRTTSGGVYNVELVDMTMEDITIAIARRGYAFASVRPRGDRDAATRTVNLVYVVEEGPRVYVERINVRGNTRTQDRVIRREFDVAEADAYNRVLIDRAERRLNQTTFFKSVKITTEPGSAPDRVVVNVDVEDQPTGAFSIAGGYSTVDGFIAEISVEERNFLGRGQFVRLGGTYGQRTQGVNFSFTEPYFLDYRLSAGFDLFWRISRRSNFQSYDATNYGGTLRLGIPVTDQFAVQLRYSAVFQKITLRQDLANCFNGYGDQLSQYVLPNGRTANYVAGDPRGTAAGTNNGLLYRDAAGQPTLANTGTPYTCTDDAESSIALRSINDRQRFISTVGYSLIYNSLDRVTNPSQGLYGELRQDFAGLGGNARFVRTTGELRYYHDLTNDIIGQIRLQAGNITGFGSNSVRSSDGSVATGGKLDVTDQFFMGPELVRGFQTAGIGTRDFASAGLSGRLPDAIGNTNYWGASAEVTFPFAFLPRDFGMRGALFADAGSVWGYNSRLSFTQAGSATALNVNLNDPRTGKPTSDAYLRSSVGLGLLWNSPFGPIRFDYSFVLAKAPFDRTQAFRFSGGTRF
ncbi:MAG: outer membrane protein assembly factor BamA [Alphaproteobacteria bacterium]